MYCTVALSFQSNKKPITTALTYKVGEHNVKINDVVEVIFRKNLMYGVVRGVYSNEVSTRNEMYRLEIERVLHTNTIYAAVRRRFNEFKDFEIKHQRKSGMRIINLIEKNHNVEYRRKVMKYVCLGNLLEEKDGVVAIWHANQRLGFMRDEDGKYILSSYERNKGFKSTWRTSAKAENYFNKLFEEYYGNS